MSWCTKRADCRLWQRHPVNTQHHGHELRQFPATHLHDDCVLLRMKGAAAGIRSRVQQGGRCLEAWRVRRAQAWQERARRRLHGRLRPGWLEELRVWRHNDVRLRTCTHVAYDAER